MKSVRELNEQLLDLSASVEALATLAEQEKRELSQDEQQEADGLLAQKAEIQDKLLPRARQIEANRIEAKARFNSNAAAREELATGVEIKAISVPARARHQVSRHFKGATANEDAYSSGQFLAATVFKNKNSQQWCREHGLNINAAMSEGSDSAGGYLVPEPLQATIINLQEMYGVYQRNARVLPMGSETLAVPRRVSGLTVYYPGENTAITASDFVFGQVLLTAKKYAGLSLMSTELNEDSIISMADLIAEEMARRFANAIDTNAFLGDGTAGFAGVSGFDDALNASSTVTAGTATDFASLDWADFQNVVAKVPQFPGAQNKWYINSYGYAAAMLNLMNAAGGNTITDLSNGGMMRFMGYPVEFAQVLQGAGAATGDTVAFFGDVGLASTMGMRRNITISSSTEVKFIEDQIAIKATERVAIEVHEGVDGTEVGPVIKLKLA